MIIDDYAYKNKLSKLNPNMKFAPAMLLLILSLINKNNYISIFTIFIMSLVIVGIAKIDLQDYIHFIKQSTKNVKTNIPLEKYLINNISCAKLLELLKAFDNELANEVINKMSDIVFNI